MTCNLDECDRPRHAYGLCGMHAQRLRRTGDPRAIRRRTTLESFWDRVQKGDDCWTWTGEILVTGYGHLASRLSPVASGSHLAHRVSYELAVGPIPAGMHLDHLCRNRCCVRPDHLEPVTAKENTARGLHGVLRTHCKYGHELTPENTQYDRRRNCRRCRTCARVWDRRAKAKRAAARSTT